MGLDRRTKRGKECSKDAFPLNQGLPSVYHIVKVSLNTMRNIPRSRFGPNHRCLVIIYTAQEQLLGYSGWGQVASSTHVLKGSLSACSCIGRIWHFKRWAKWKKLNHQRCVLEGDFETLAHFSPSFTSWLPWSSACHRFKSSGARWPHIKISKSTNQINLSSFKVDLPRHL